MWRFCYPACLSGMTYGIFVFIPWLIFHYNCLKGEELERAVRLIWRSCFPVWLSEKNPEVSHKKDPGITSSSLPHQHKAAPITHVKNMLKSFSLKVDLTKISHYIYAPFKNEIFIEALVSVPQNKIESILGYCSNRNIKLGSFRAICICRLGQKPNWTERTFSVFMWHILAVT